MFDYNFFEGYKRKKSRKSTGNKIPIIVFLSFLVILVGIGGFTFFTLVKTGAEIALLSTEINAPENQETLARITEKQNMIVQLQAMNDSLLTAPQTLDQKNPINRLLMDNMFNSLPADVQLTDISFDPTTVSLSGKAGLRSAVAEFEHNLRLVVPESSIAVSDITLSENEYTFSMTMTVGGGDDAVVE